MAVIRVAAIHHYVGLIGDTKPTVDVPPGSRFFEFDDVTDNVVREWVFDGTQWMPLIAPAT